MMRGSGAWARVKEDASEVAGVEFVEEGGEVTLGGTSAEDGDSKRLMQSWQQHLGGGWWDGRESVNGIVKKNHEPIRLVGVIYIAFAVWANSKQQPIVPDYMIVYRIKTI